MQVKLLKLQQVETICFEKFIFLSNVLTIALSLLVMFNHDIGLRRFK